MTNEKDIVGKVVTDFTTTRGAEGLQSTFEKLIKLQDTLTGKTKDQVVAVSKLFDEYQNSARKFKVGSDQEKEAFAVLQNSVLGLSRSLKTLGVNEKGLKLVSNDEVANLKQVMAQFKELENFFKNQQRNQQISQGTFGINPKSIAEAKASIKELQGALLSVKGSMSLSGADLKGLRDFELQIKKNTGLIYSQMQALQQAENQAKGNALNAWGTYQQDVRNQRIDMRRRMDEGNAAAAARDERIQFNYSPLGNQFQRVNSIMQTARAETAVRPDVANARLSGLYNSADRSVLRSIYGDAGFSYSASADNIKQSDRVKAITGEIVGLERQLLSIRANGNKDLERELEILKQIRTLRNTQDRVRQDERLSDPERQRETQTRQAVNMLGRTTGEGGAALLTVQANLMANYALMNGVLGGIRQGITYAVQLESEFRNVQAVTATTNTQMAGLEKTLMSVAATSKFSSTEVAQGALLLGQAGMSAKQVAEAIQPVVMLATAAGTNISQAVDLVTSVVGVFDKAVSDTADVANKITAAANNSKVSVEKLGQGFQYAGNLAAQLGISFEETTAAMAAMSNAGIKSGSTMGTGLRQFLSEVEKPSKEFTEALNRVGLTMADLDFKSKGLINVAQRLREAGFVASDSIKSFDVRGAAAFNAMIANPEDLQRQYTGLLNTKAGIEANEIQMNSLAAQSARLGTSLGNLASVGLTPVMQALTGMAGGAATAVQGLSELGPLVGVVGTALAGLAASAAASYVINLGKGFISLAAALPALIGGLSGATVAANGATTALAGLSLASGIGLLVGVATVAFTTFNYVSGETKRKLDEVKAASVEAKAAFDEKAQTVKSLETRIENLNANEMLLRDNQNAVKLESQALTSQFGSLGGVIDSNNTSFDVLINKLRGVRDEMIKLKQVSLGAALSAALKEQEALGQDAEKKMTLLKGSEGRENVGLNVVAQLEKLTGRREEIVKLFGSEVFESIVRGTKSLRDGKGENTADTAFLAANIRKITDEKSGVAMSSMDRNLLRNSMPKLDDYSTASGKMFSNNMLISQLTQQAAMDSSMTKFRAANPTFDTDFGTRPKLQDLVRYGVSKQMAERYGIEERAGLSAQEMKRPDLVAKAAKDIGVQLQSALKAKESRLVMSDLLPEVRAEIQQRIARSSSELTNDIRTSTEQGKETSEFFLNSEKRANEARLKTLAQKRSRTQAEKDEGVSLIRKIGASELSKETLGMVPSSDPKNAPGRYEDAVETNRVVVEERIKQFLQKPDAKDAALKTAEKIDNLQDEILQRISHAKQLAEVRAAESDRALANMLTNYEDVERLAKSGEEHMKAAAEAAKQQLLIKQENDRKKFRNAGVAYPAALETANKGELEDLARDWKSKIEIFLGNFKGFSKAASRHMTEMTEKLKKGEQDLIDTKQAGEDRVYKEGEYLRQLELALATGKNTRDASGIRSRTTYNNLLSDKEEEETRRIVASGDGYRETRSSRTTGERRSGSSITFGEGGASSTVGDRTGRATGFGNLRYGRDGESGTLKQRINRETIRVAKIELEENEKMLALLGDDKSGMIGDYASLIEGLNSRLDLLQPRIRALRSKVSAGQSLNAEEREELEKLESQETELKKGKSDLQSKKNSTVNQLKTARKENTDIQVKIAKNTEEIPEAMTLDSIEAKLKKVWGTWTDMVQDMDLMKTMADGFGATLGSVTGSLGNTFAAIATGTKSVKQGFKDMTVGVLKNIVDIMSQMLAMRAIQSLVGLAMGGASASAAPIADAGISSIPTTYAATGGYITRTGIERVRRFETGGSVTGGVPGKDSVPALLMPGEFVMKKSAVDAIGTDFLHGLNTATNNVVSSNQNSRPASKNDKSGNGVVNVYVVTPDQQPSLGPQDVLVVVSDDIARGGQINKLVKQVQMGQI